MKKLSLREKFLVAFMSLAVIVAATGTAGVVINKWVSNRIQSALTTTSAQEQLVLRMEVNLKICQVHLLEATKVVADQQKFEEALEDYQAKRDIFVGYCDILLKGNKKLDIPAAASGSILESRIKKVQNSWHNFEKVADQVLERKASLMRGTKNGVADQRAKLNLADPVLGRLSGEVLSDATEKAKLSVDELLIAVGDLVKQSEQDVAKIQAAAFTFFLLVTVAAIVLAALLGLLLSQYIVKRINRMAKILGRSTEGDLTSRITVDSSDELGKVSNDFNAMVERLSEMIGKVKVSTTALNRVASDLFSASRHVIDAAERQAKGVEETSSAVSQINASINGVAHAMDSLTLSASESSSSILEMAASIEEVALNVENLSHSVEEVSTSIVEMAASIKQIGSSVQSLMEASTTTASSIAEMHSSIRQVEKNAMDTASISESVRRDAETGKSAVDAAIDGMNGIRQSSKITAEVIETLSERANAIGSIVSVIDEVAEQTNLLALNAAIIAAQAGEHGKGFAVVADEIKELAERTSVSTREIVRLIEGVQKETQRAVEAITQAEERISEGEVLSQRSGEALEKIVAGVQRASDQVAEIARAAVEQAKGSTVIREAAERVSEMVGQIANATKEQTNGSELIMSAVERMKSLTIQVRGSAREQSKVGGFIARSTENITGMIQQIKTASDEQTRGSAQIVNAVEEIHNSTNINLDAARIMDDAVSSLSQQIEILHREMEHFKTEGASSGPFHEVK